MIAERVLRVGALVCAAAFTHLATAPIVLASPDDRPIADGTFTSPADPGWIFFRPQGFDGSGCGMGPDGTVGCDIVPARWGEGTPVQAGVPGPPGFYSCEGRRCPLPPPDVTQTVVSSQAPAAYVVSTTESFTRDVDTLPAGYRLVNGDAWCSLSEQGTLRCVSGPNGFTLNSLYGILD